jgi:hypothetical protein
MLLCNDMGYRQKQTESSLSLSLANPNSYVPYSKLIPRPSLRRSFGMLGALLPDPEGDSQASSWSVHLPLNDGSLIVTSKRSREAVSSEALVWCDPTRKLRALTVALPSLIQRVVVCDSGIEIAVAPLPTELLEASNAALTVGVWENRRDFGAWVHPAEGAAEPVALSSSVAEALAITGLHNFLRPKSDQ